MLQVLAKGVLYLKPKKSSKQLQKGRYHIRIVLYHSWNMENALKEIQCILVKYGKKPYCNSHKIWLYATDNEDRKECVCRKKWKETS